MEISKTSNISVDYKDRRAPPSWQTHLVADIILIDKTNNALHPTIYQLKDTVVPSNHQILYWKSGAINIPQEAFVLIGEAVTIDKKKKQILLTNNNVISYKYLIITSGSERIFSFRNERFTAALQALIDALRIKPKIPSSFAKHSLLQTKLRLPSSLPQQFSTTVKSVAIESVAQPQICQALNHKLLGPDLHTISKRLFEVHL